MAKRSAIVIVCNGEPFIRPQLENIYDHVDEIIICEGADKFFQKVIKSKRSTDRTIEIIKSFPDPDNKIKLLHINAHKNEMVKIGNSVCTGDYIYQVDVDEFLRPIHIEEAFKLLKDSGGIVGVPQRWYYKWDDAFLESTGKPRKNLPKKWLKHPLRASIKSMPVRFYHNKWDKGLAISHLNNTGYRRRSDNKFVPGNIHYLPFDSHAYHYLAIKRKQLEDKMKYYSIRGDTTIAKIKERINEFDSISRDSVGKILVKSYTNSKLVLETRPFMRFK